MLCCLNSNLIIKGLPEAAILAVAVSQESAACRAQHTSLSLALSPPLPLSLPLPLSYQVGADLMRL